jgi:hypothetical protein
VPFQEIGMAGKRTSDHTLDDSRRFALPPDLTASGGLQHLRKAEVTRSDYGITDAPEIHGATFPPGLEDA